MHCFFLPDVENITCRTCSISYGFLRKLLPIRREFKEVNCFFNLSKIRKCQNINIRAKSLLLLEYYYTTVVLKGDLTMCLPGYLKIFLCISYLE